MKPSMMYFKSAVVVFLFTFTLVGLVSLLPHVGKSDDVGMVFRKEATVVNVHECFDAIDFIECRVELRVPATGEVYVASVFNRVFPGRRVYDICRMDRVDGEIMIGCLNHWSSREPTLFKTTYDDAYRILEVKR